MKWEPKVLDYEISPYTGLTRDSWLEAAEYMLEGIFRHIRHFEDPVVVPRQETAITYPHLQDPPQAQRSQRSAEIFEGLTRSFFIAAPLIANRPETSAGGYSLAEYYKYQVLRSCTRLRTLRNAAGEDESYVGTYEEIQAINHTDSPYSCYQQTVETCALVICLWISREQIWDTYSKEEKDAIAAFLGSYAHHATVPQNWRLFNMLDMAFLHMEGYPVDEKIMREHTQAILNYYVGDGWYRDGHSFDYYSCWAFNMYAPLWNLWYGYENMPCAAARFEEHSNKLMETYGDFFDRDGWTNMWGRSNVYRFAAVSAFDGNLLMPGGKAFLCLHLPAEHPFWTARENNGTWETLAPGQVRETCLDGPALCFTNHEKNGETVLRSGKVVKNKGDIHGMWNYSKLCYNTKYPWESAPEQGLESQQYVLRDGESGAFSRANVTFWCGRREGVLYRRQFFDYDLENECHWIQAMNLADFPVPSGILRVDKLRLHRTPIRLTLGAYGFPDNGTEVLERQCGYTVKTGVGTAYTDGGTDTALRTARAVILKGHDSTGREKQLAMTVYDGWESLDVRHSTGTNPDSEHSLIACAETSQGRLYGNEPYILISQVITKESLEDFTEEELFPVARVEYADPEGCGGYGPVEVWLRDGSRRSVCFEGIEGQMML